MIVSSLLFRQRTSPSYLVVLVSLLFGSSLTKAIELDLNDTGVLMLRIGSSGLDLSCRKVFDRAEELF
jgi:hypothetical protein